MNVYKLGRNPSPHDPRTLKLADFVNLSTLPTVPSAFDWSMKDGVPLVYGMDGNDQYGDCVFASACHQIGTWTGQTGTEQVATAADALAAYTDFTGFDPSDPSTDQGADMLTVGKQWLKKPIFDHRPAAFVSVDLKRPDLVAAACNLFGGLWTGWALPTAWQGADEWTTGPSTSGQWAPGSWGGHAVHFCLVSPAMFGVKTWAQHMGVTPAALATYCDEAIALISSDVWLALVGNRCPAGLDGPGLEAALTLVTA